jgi:hypothetical protein
MGILQKQAEQRRHEEEKRNKEHNKSKGKEKTQSSGRQNQFVYLFSVAKRFYSAIFTEAGLGLIMSSVLFGWAYMSGLKVIQIPVNFFVFWTVCTVLFVLQGLMFRRS